MAAKRVKLSQSAKAILARRLRSLLRQRGWSARQLADAAKLPKTRVAALTLGNGEPDLAMLLAIAAVLELRSLDELIAPLGSMRLQWAQGRRSKVL